MSKLPIAAFLPPGTTSVLDQELRNFTSKHVQEDLMQNHTIPSVTLADSNVSASPVTLCVDGVLLWLLLAWMTAGTAAIITLMIKSCRSGWKQVDHDELNWSSLNAIQHHSTKSERTRSTSCPSVPSLRNVAVIPSVLPTPGSSGLTKSSQNQNIRPPHFSSRRDVSESSRRSNHRSRRIQSTTA